MLATSAPTVTDSLASASVARAASRCRIYLGDAQIVWRGNAAYSANAATMAQIGQTQGVTALTGDLAAGDELWIRY
jgi:hypothetical protein